MILTLLIQAQDALSEGDYGLVEALLVEMERVLRGEK